MQHLAQFRSQPTTCFAPRLVSVISDMLPDFYAVVAEYLSEYPTISKAYRLEIRGLVVFFNRFFSEKISE